MLRRFLVVGLGGSGGKTVRVARQDVQQRLKAGGFEGSFPAGWQFLWIDVPAVPEEGALPVPQLPADAYLGLVSRAVTYSDIHESLSHQPGASEGLANWEPSPPSRVAVPLSVGAGQFRGIGRTVALARLGSIANAIRHAIERMEGATVKQELHRAATHLGTPQEDRLGDPAPIAIIVSSIAGGAGSGLLMDVADVIRDVTGGDGHWGDTSIGLLYAPDVFSSIPGPQRAGVQPNALATLAEILAGYWSESEVDATESGFFAQAGIGELVGRRRGPGRPFLIGASNGQVRFTNPDHVFEAIGRQLGAWISSEAVQESLEAYIGANWVMASLALPSKSGLLPPGSVPNPFSSAGYARVDLGRQRFATYASERLARKSVDHLLRAHWDGRPVPEDMTDEAALKEVVEARFGEFQLRSQLDELGEENNQIIDALRPEDRESRIASYAADIKARATDNIETDTGDNFVRRIARAYEDVRGTFADEDRTAVQAKGRQWTEQIQTSYTNHVARYVARHGGPVTVQLLARQEAILQEVSVELRSEAQQRYGWSRAYREGISEVLATGAKLGADHPNVGKGAQRAAKALEWWAEGELRDLCAALVLDLRRNVVAQLRRALELAVDDLRVRDNSDEVIYGVPMDQWSRTAPPRRLRHSPNEFFLTAVDEFPSHFVEQVSRTLDDDPQTAEFAALATVISPDDGSLITRSRRWVPEKMEIRGHVDDSPSEARFEFSIRPESLIDRAEAWVREPDTAIGEFVSEGLRSYLSSDNASPDEHNERLVAFRAAFSSAIEVSEPLIDINPGMMMQIHGQGEIPTLPLITVIPLDEDEPAYRVAHSILVESGMTAVDAAAKFGDGEAATVEITTFLASPLDTPVFDSVVGPIGDDWEKRTADLDGQTRFWQWRRTRHLPAFIPVPTEARRAMIRGWFSARIMDQIDDSSSGPEGSKLIRIHVPGRSVPAEFPSPLLTPRPSAADLMPSVLESLPLALLNTGRSDLYREAYARLMSLGISDPHGIESYSTINPELGEWLNDAGAGPGQSRYEAALERCSRWLENYRKTFEPPPTEDPRSGFHRPMAWELRADIESGLVEIIEAIRRAEQEETSGEDAFA